MEKKIESTINISESNSTVPKGLIKTFLNDFLKISINTKREQYLRWFMETGKYYEDIATEYPYTYKRVNMKDCFANSQYHAFNHNLAYIEGYYVCNKVPLPLEHAFNIDGGGQVIDVTNLKFNLGACEYFGVEIPKDVLEEYIFDDSISDFIPPLQYYYYDHILKE